VSVDFDAQLVKVPSRSVLRFQSSPKGETYLAEQLLRFPYHITRVHRATACSQRADLCLQALGGGLVEGDDIRLAVELGTGTRVKLTNQSATKVHSMRGGRASQKIKLDVNSGAWLEYMPKPLILFPGSDSHNTTRVRMAGNSGAVIVDSFYRFDPSGNGRPPLFFSNTVEVFDINDRLLVRDAMSVSSADFIRPFAQRGLDCQCGIFLLGSAGEASSLKGLRYQTPHADLACTQLPNKAGMCLRGFIAGPHALASVMSNVLALLKKSREIAT
tara:strand:- start:664 stop:1482 length:819 start_codon:yes stop_codon:yes gene_type:complete